MFPSLSNNGLRFTLVIILSRTIIEVQEYLDYNLD